MVSRFKIGSHNSREFFSCVIYSRFPDVCPHIVYLGPKISKNRILKVYWYKKAIPRVWKMVTMNISIRNIGMRNSFEGFTSMNFSKFNLCNQLYKKLMQLAKQETILLLGPGYQNQDGKNDWRYAIAICLYQNPEWSFYFLLKLKTIILIV